MSDSIKHECGIAMLRLLKPLDYYKKKYGTPFYGIDKMYLLMEKQHNRGQDGAGFASIKLDMEPGERYISRIRSIAPNPIKDVFSKINERIAELINEFPQANEDSELLKKKAPYVGELFLGHVRYGTSGKNVIESVHPFLRQNNWMHRNLIVAGNFNMINLNEMFDKLVHLGQHPKEKVDTVTIMEKIGHFLDKAVANSYRSLKKEGITKKEASSLIIERLNLIKILKKASKNWDGGYTMGGLLGHGDAFALRDPWGIRPCYYYQNEEVVVVASERPPIQTVFDVNFSDVKELDPGKALIIKSGGEVFTEKVIKPKEKKSCSFERIYFSRGNDQEIYKERKKLGALTFTGVMKKIDNDIDNTVFSYIPNTAETAFLGIVKASQDYLNQYKTEQILKNQKTLDENQIRKIMGVKTRIEKIAVKDVKLRTFISEDSTRKDLMTHVYDITYGVVKPTDNLVVLDDSIVRGTTLKNSILQILSRLNPKRIIIVSSAPQIRYPDCYGIDMANLKSLIVFQAAIQLHRDLGTWEETKEDIYKKCKEQSSLPPKEIYNAVKALYAPFTDEQISDKIAEMLSENISTEISIVFQKIENLHKACPNHRGDWYFTGNYPTPRGNKIANNAFINYYEGINKRAY